MSTNEEEINKLNKNIINNYNNNMIENEECIPSREIKTNNIILKNENSLSEMNDNNTNGHNNNFQPQQKIILKSESKKKNINTNKNKSHSYLNKKNKSLGHISINSKNKPKLPNLIRNVHYRKDLKKNNGNDNFRYQPISSFEKKLSKELCRISSRYTVVKNRKFFNNDSNITDEYWSNFPDYKIYRQLKEIETRKELPNAFSKPRLKPLIVQNKNKLSILARNLYEAEQIDKLKKLMYKQYKIKNEK